MTEQVQLQEILGVDKKNPFFTLCENAEQPGKLLVYFGMSLLEVLDNAPDNPAFKLLLARLYNAGVKPQALMETFCVAYTTLRRWGDALKSGDSEKLISVLAGRQHPRKLTTEILSFSETRFYAIYPKNNRTYSKVIRQEILETFGQTISGESLRPYFARWRDTLTARGALIDNVSPQSDEPQQTHNNLLEDVVTQGLNENIEAMDKNAQQTLPSFQSIQNLPVIENAGSITHSKPRQSPDFEANSKPIMNSRPAVRDTLSPNNEITTQEQDANRLISPASEEENNHEPGQGCQESARYEDDVPHNRKHAVVLTTREPAPQRMTLPNGGYQFCHHAGVLLFSGFLNELRHKITTRGELIVQWLSAILLGAVNIEQSKLLNYPSLARFFGQVLSDRHKQRQALAEMAQTSCVDELLQLNGQWMGIRQWRDFYYDPHSKHYTGAHKLLKGWCSRLRFAEKVLHMDFIHTPTGAPVYLSHDDNYQDLRERFFDVVGKFRQVLGFASSTVLTFVLDRGIYGIDTFETFLTEKVKNHFITWEKGFCADKHKDIQWQQSMSLYRAKNSSKDLKRYHFSYYSERWSRHNKIRRIMVKATNPKGRSITVSILCSDLTRCAKEIIALMFDRWLQENDFKYLDVHFGINEITSYATLSYKQIEQTLKDKQENSGRYKALEKQRVQLKAQLKTQLLNEHRAKNSSTKRKKKITVLTQQLNELEDTIAQTEKEVSRLKRLLEENYEKLDTAKKSVMDSVKILARNVFYEGLEPFKKSYDNYRDDHMLFRHLTRSPGLIRYTGECIDVLLIPQACFSPKVLNIFHSILGTFNHRQLYLPDGRECKITIRLLHDNKGLFEL